MILSKYIIYILVSIIVQNGFNSSFSNGCNFSSMHSLIENDISIDVKLLAVYVFRLLYL